MCVIKKGAYSLILFLFGGIGYSFIEVLWRGFTHWSMILLSSDGNSGRTVLRQITFMVLLLFCHSFNYLPGVYNRLRGQSGAWLGCLELC